MGTSAHDTGPEEPMSGDPQLGAMAWALIALQRYSSREGSLSMWVRRQSARALWLRTACCSVWAGSRTSVGGGGGVHLLPNLCHVCSQCHAQSVVKVFLPVVQVPPTRRHEPEQEGIDQAPMRIGGSDVISDKIRDPGSLAPTLHQIREWGVAQDSDIILISCVKVSGPGMLWMHVCMHVCRVLIHACTHNSSPPFHRTEVTGIHVHIWQVLGGHAWDGQLIACGHDELLLHQVQVAAMMSPSANQGCLSHLAPLGSLQQPGKLGGMQGGM